MINKRKRKLAVLSSVFALIWSFILFVVSALALIGRLTGKDSANYSNSILYKLNASPLATLQDCINEYSLSLDSKLFYGILAGLVLVGFIMFVLSICNFKSPIREDGRVKYRGFLMFLQFVFSLAIAGGAVYVILDKSAPFKNVANNEVISYLLYAYIALGGLTFLFTLFSFFCKKYKKEKAVTRQESIDKRVDMLFNGKQGNVAPVVKCNAVPVSVTKKEDLVNVAEISPIVKVIEEKIVRVNQLKEMGIITDAQYNAAIARLINSI